MEPHPAAETAPTSEAAAPAPPPAPRRRWRRRLAISAGLVAAYGLAGGLLAPRLLRGAIQEKGSAALHRAVTVREVRINPFTLAITISGLEVADLTAPRLAGWESLHVRLAPWKALRGDLGVAELRLVRPFGHLALDAAGRLNVQDLLDGDPAATSAPPQAPPAAGSGLGVALDRLEIEEARLIFDDATRSPAFQTALGPLSVRLSDFRTRGGADSPYAFTGATEAGETFSWSGTVLSEPLRSTGTIAFTGVKLTKYDAYLREQAPALLIQSGAVSLRAGYHLAWGAGARKATLSGLEVVAEGLALARRRDQSVALSLPRLELTGGEIDALGQVATFGALKVSGGALSPRREPDGKVTLLEMLERPPRAAAPSAPPAPAPPSSTRPSSAPWRWSLGALAIEGLAVSMEDLVPARPVRLAIPALDVRLTGLEGRPDVACPLTVSARVGEAGTARATGTVWPFASRAELTLEAAGLDLAPLGPYLDGAAPLRLAEGRLGLAARVKVDASGAAPDWTFGGDVKLEAFSLRHPARGEELARWRSLELLGIDAASKGQRASLKTVRVTEPSLRAVIFEDGVPSFGPAAPPPGGAAAEAASAEASQTRPAAAPAAPAPTGPAWRTAIGLFQVVRGRLTFVDRSVKPAVLLSLTDVESRIANLSSDPRVRSTVDVKARAFGAAPLAVTGTLNPLQAEAFTDLSITAKGVDLSPLGPYAGKHLGYGLQKGKLDLDLAYKVQQRSLLAGNLVRLDQLTLGEATHSPDATAIPVRLALALLRDRNGLILLDVPVEGRLDDPEFKLGRVIWRTVLNVLVKVAASPFSALASLAGGGQEDISLVEFAPGAVALEEAGRKRVELLARSLADRPGLGLEVEGTVDPARDDLALRRAELEHRLRRLKAEGRHLQADQEPAAVTADERPQLLEALLRATFPPAPAQTGTAGPAAGAAPQARPTPAEQEARLVEAMTVPAEALPALAAARTGAVRDALLAAGVDPSRLFVVQGGDRARKEAGPRAFFTVRE
jgi:hypothetical protein